ncbi:hypothetical protein [Sphingobium chungbukense]|uniref:Uncharacterized protein n=1 Tax=Sphingobium chungbukense TaxID=56193 RepID=A0A0M3AUS7_9SPHN|nr:hypothetical protein [Sphingobium chungbukense]KKW93962.1 hypothetical protein YP76_04830 [Sphingobium chungbukense]
MITRVGVQPVIATGGPAAGRQSYIVTSTEDGVEVTSPAVVSVSTDLGLAGNMNVVHWDGGNPPFRVYKSEGGAYGFIGTSKVRRLIDDNIAPNTRKRPPSA